MSLVAQLNAEPANPLNCTIAQSSAHSGRYVPENILVDRPTDQSSRWSGAFQGNVKQWIVLKLETLSVLKSITFGKFFKPHPCNMKEFKIYVGTTPEHMTEVLRASLKNDSTYEHFPVKYTNNSGVCFPARYVKLVPVSAHGQSFHISIWHVALSGISNESLVEQVRTSYDEYRETAVLRHILKHLRQRRLLTPFESILSRSQADLEHPLITQLHESVVLQGDWARAEELIPTISEAGLFDSYLRGSQPYANWKQLHGTDADGDVPSPRGGHAMCIDPVNEMMYVLGGWDGKKSLDDFWVYSIKEDKWRVLSHSTSDEQNAPGARSCHKMVFDTKTGSIYVLGRLSDSDTAKPSTNPRSPGLPPNDPRNNPPSPTTFCSEFYRYHTRGIDKGKWDFLSFDTATSGGPPLIFDHQMVMDSDAQIIYVFGGRIVDGDWNSLKYSGLYSYNIRLSKWRSLQSSEASVSKTIIPPRSGHSMVLDSLNRMLYIFAGSCEDRYLCDMYTYDITTNTATEVTSNFELSGGPDGSFAQRAVIDLQSQEIYVFCGLRRSAQTGASTTLSSDSPSWLYNYSKSPGTWTKIISHPSPGHFRSPSDYPDHDEFEPIPRYAHQVVYNPKTKSILLHGGNAGPLGQLERAGMEDDGDEEQDNEDGVKEHRLDDLWQMSLTRAGAGDVIRRAKFKIRQQQQVSTLYKCNFEVDHSFRFREMCEEASPIDALDFLQNEVSTVVDHNDPFETELFRSLLTHLLTPPSPIPASPDLPSHNGSEERSPISPASDQWTSQLPIEDPQSDFGGGPRSVRVDALKASEDPVEGLVRRRGDSPLTAARFSQRNEVFESLLEFVSEREKQPEGSLLDIIEGEEMAL